MEGEGRRHRVGFLTSEIKVINAYVSGMKEDLGMSGQDYNFLQTMFTAGVSEPFSYSHIRFVRISTAHKYNTVLTEASTVSATFLPSSS